MGAYADQGSDVGKNLQEKAKEPCVFCELEQWELAIGPWLNIEPLNPVTPGHRLFIPRGHIKDAVQLPGATGQLFAAAARWGARQGDQFNLITSRGEAATQSVFHFHVHYVPRREGDGLHLPWTGQAKKTCTHPNCETHGNSPVEGVNCRGEAV